VQDAKGSRDRGIGDIANDKLDVIYDGAWRAATNRGHECVPCLGRPVGDELDTPVRSVADPPRQSKPRRFRPHVPAKSYTLHSADNAEVERRHPPKLVPNSQ
jgi:hypothetical protein